VGEVVGLFVGGSEGEVVGLLVGPAVGSIIVWRTGAPVGGKTGGGTGGEPTSSSPQLTSNLRRGMAQKMFLIKPKMKASVDGKMLKITRRNKVCFIVM